MSQQSGSPSQGNILVVDDNPSNLRFLVGMLSEQGYKVRPALNGTVALLSVKSTLPDLILLDIMMPEMNGYEVCEQLKADRATRDIPVIFISALNEAFDKVRAFEIGGVDYITKPFEMEEVLARVENQLSVQSLKKQLAQENARLQKEICDRKQAQAELQKSEERYRRIVETASEGIWIIDAESKTTFVNAKMAEMLGYTVDEMMELSMFAFVDAEGDAIAKANVERRLQGIQEQQDFKFCRKDGSYLWAIVSTSPIFDEAGQYAGSLGMITDITERKQAEEQIKESLREKEVLLKEVHHRVKNNLQVIYSLLNLQSRSIKDQTIFTLFKESQNRVKSMGLIHEKLYQSKDLSRIELGEYVKDLVKNLFWSYNVQVKDINLKINIESIFIDINLAAPCGLIINELVSNCLKHAFPDTKKGEVCIDFYPEIESNFNLIVKDNGIGFPPDINFKNTKTLGLQLVCNLTKQLGGSIEMEVNSGTQFKITFPEKRL